MTGDDLVAEGQVDGAVLGGEREKHRLRHNALHPTDDSDSDHRKPEIKTYFTLKKFH
jgi:hypothetical protein